MKKKSTETSGAQHYDDGATYLRSLEAVHFQAALGNFVSTGAQNNRTYSACGLAISAGEPPKASSEPQSAYGGNSSMRNFNTAREDRFGPIEFKCKNGHWNKRLVNKLITECRVKTCKNSVGC